MLLWLISNQSGNTAFLLKMREKRSQELIQHLTQREQRTHMVRATSLSVKLFGGYSAANFLRSKQIFQTEKSKQVVIEKDCRKHILIIQLKRFRFSFIPC